MCSKHSNVATKSLHRCYRKPRPPRRCIGHADTCPSTTPTTSNGAGRANSRTNDIQASMQASLPPDVRPACQWLYYPERRVNLEPELAGSLECQQHCPTCGLRICMSRPRRMWARCTRLRRRMWWGILWVGSIRFLVWRLRAPRIPGHRGDAVGLQRRALGRVGQGAAGSRVYQSPWPMPWLGHGMPHGVPMHPGVHPGMPMPPWHAHGAVGLMMMGAMGGPGLPWTGCQAKASVAGGEGGPPNPWHYV